jgi:hypothetical protein
MSNRKKNVGNHYDDEFETMTNPRGTEEIDSMAQYNSYERFDVDAKSEQLKQSCKKMILSLCDIYLETLTVSNEDYVKSVALIEEQNLFVLMKQVQYSDHVLDSLMRQLDNGGYVDKSIYDTIRQMQKSAIQITLEISKYTRNLPEYFKFVSRDAKSVDSTEILLNAAKTRNSEFLEISAESSDDQSTDFASLETNLKYSGRFLVYLEISSVICIADFCI